MKYLLDYNSLKPEICSEHKMICALFCTSCTEIHCTKCVSKHTNHNIMSLKEKASEVRSKIFEKLSELENSENCIRETKEHLIENRDSHIIGYESLVQKISSELDKVKQAVLNRIKIEHDKVMGAGKESDDNLELLFKSEKDLRGLLSQSNGLMVTKFPEINLQIRTVHEVQQSLVSLEVKDIEHKFEAYGFEATAQDFLKQCIERIQMPLLKNISEPEVLSEDSDNQLLDQNVTRLNLSDDHFVYLRDHESIYSICAVEKEVFVYEHQFVENENNDTVNANGSANASPLQYPIPAVFGAARAAPLPSQNQNAFGGAGIFTSVNPPLQAQTSTTRTSLRNSCHVSMKRLALGKYTCPEKIKQLIVYPHLSSSTIYILTDLFNLVFEIETKNFRYFNLVDNSDRDKLLVISDKSQNGYKWSLATKTINCTAAEVGGSFPCESKPTVKMSYYDTSLQLLCAVLTTENDVVLLFNKNVSSFSLNEPRRRPPTTTPQRTMVSKTVRGSVHKVKQIDAVSIVSGKILIWSLLTKNITIISNTAFPTVESVVPFKYEFRYFSIPYLGTNLLFLVKAKMERLQNEDKEVFMVRKL